MKLTKNYYMMIILGLTLLFIAPVTLLSSTVAPTKGQQADITSKTKAHAPEELNKRKNRVQMMLDKMNLVERFQRSHAKRFAKVPKATTPVIEKKGPQFKEFDFTKNVEVSKGWYEGLGETCKETSTTGKGPLWAKIATSLTTTKTERGESMYGVKLKL